MFLLNNPQAGPIISLSFSHQYQEQSDLKKGPNMTALVIPTHALLERPVLRSWSELASLCEIVDGETGAFRRCTFTYRDKDDIVWFGHHTIPRMELTMEDVNIHLQLVSDEKIYPLATQLVTIVDDPKAHFIKRPKLHVENDLVSNFMAESFYEEVQVLEILKQHSHPNIVRYFGCTVKASRITGIVLEQHNMILARRFGSPIRDFNVAACISDIQAGIDHLLSLGFAHNDLNPNNIALDYNGRPVILDFGSCKRYGEMLRSAGTPGWADNTSHLRPNTIVMA